jgi:hypothetical protein
VKTSRSIPITVATVAVALVAAWALPRLTSRVRVHVYTQRIVYTTLPADDQALTDWLRSQPGVSRATVSRMGDTLVVVFVMPMSANDPAPNVFQEARRFGYAGPRDSSSTFQPRWQLP